MTSIRLHQLSKRFAEHQALASIDLEIPSACLFALLGPSGCGKTTLLRIIAGLESADHGDVFFDQRAVTQLRAEQRRIGMVFQHYALFPHMTVAGNVAFGLKSQGLNKTLIREKVCAALDRVNLLHKIDQPCPQLSGGEQQRVALARALVIEPAILLFDEPLSNLDARLRIETRQAIRQLVQELQITAIFVTHDQEEALSVADQMAVMRDGQILQVGSPEHCYQQPNNSFVGNFLGRANIFTDIQPFKRAFPQHFPSDSKPVREVLIRPEHFTLCGPAEAVLSGHMVLREFQGAQQRLHIRCQPSADAPSTAAPALPLIEVTLDAAQVCPALGEPVFLYCQAAAVLGFHA